MRHARKLVLFAMLAIAATAQIVPSAFAQTEPELHNQAPRILAAQEVHGANDVACPAVTPSPPPNPGPNATTGGCVQHYSAQNVLWTGHPAGGAEVLHSTCDVEFDVRLDAAGEGYATHPEITQGSAGTCDRAPCVGANGEGRAWTIHMQETEVAGQGAREEMVLLTCTFNVSTPETPFHCEFTIPISQTAPHRYRWAAIDVAGHGSPCGWTGTFDQEAALGGTCEQQADQNVEIRHT